MYVCIFLDIGMFFLNVLKNLHVSCFTRSFHIALDAVEVTGLPVAMTQGEYKFKISTVAEPDGIKGR